MKVTLFTDDLISAPVNLLAVGVFSDEPDRGVAFSDLNAGLEGRLERACREEDFKGKAGQTVLFNTGEKMPAQRVLVYGFGARDAYSPEAARRFAGEAARVAVRVGAKSMAVELTILGDPAPPATVLGLVEAIAEGAELGTYAYTPYLTKERREPALEHVQIAFVAEDVRGLKGAALRQAAARGQVIAKSVATARSLVNAPPNELTPVALAEHAKRIAKERDLACKILTPRDLERQQMNLHLGVARGSQHEPRLIHLTYTPAKKQPSPPVIAFVGKGLTFDSGGLSLKTSEGMMSMKVDMGGAAAVLGALEAIATLAPDCVVHGIIGAAENMPDGQALRPGDVLTSKRGLTVEVLNTDAEGRLVLADALAYAQEQGCHEIIDLATLTGACMVALGPLSAGAFVNDEAMAEDLAEAWKKSGEMFWRMPLQSELREQLKSDVADIKNIGDRYGGAITAALFLAEFIGPDVRWAHLDIAGPVTSAKDGGHVAKGGTGFGVRTLVEYASRVAARVS